MEPLFSSSQASQRAANTDDENMDLDLDVRV